MGLLPRLFGVLRGAEAVLFLKAFAKVGRVLKPDPVGDFAHIDFVLSKQLGGMFQPDVADKGTRRYIEQPLQLAVEVYPAQVDGFG